MATWLTEEKKKELREKSEYYRRHPEKAHRDALKRRDDYVPIGIMPEEKEKK